MSSSWGQHAIIHWIKTVEESLAQVQIEPPLKPFLANHYCYSMSTWVWVVHSEEPDDDEPKEVWFTTGASQKRKRSKKGTQQNKKSLITCEVFQIQGLAER